MDHGLIKLLEVDEEDGIGMPVSGAVVDAYTERLKGVLSGGRTGAIAYGLARAGNGSLKPMLSLAPFQAPTPFAGMPKAIPAAMQITQGQWYKLTPQQQQVYLQQHLYHQQLVQRQAQQRQQQLVYLQQHLCRQQLLERHSQQRQQQEAGAAGVQAQRRPTSFSQGISFGPLMPLLQPYLPPDKSGRLNALYQRFKQNEITREDFVRGARVIVGDQVLVQTIRLMHG